MVKEEIYRLRINWIELLPKSLSQELRQQMAYSELDVDQVLYEKGSMSEGIYEVVSGRLKLTANSSDGREVILGVYDSPSTLSDSTTIAQCPHFFTATAIEESRVGLLKTDRFLALRKQYPEINEYLVESICRRMTLMFEYFEASSNYDAEVQLASRLNNLAGISYRTLKDAEDNQRIVIETGQDVLACMLGASRQTVNRILKKWELLGIVKLGYGRLVITNKKLLSDLLKERRE